MKQLFKNPLIALLLAIGHLALSLCGAGVSAMGAQHTNVVQSYFTMGIVEVAGEVDTEAINDAVESLLDEDIDSAIVEIEPTSYALDTFIRKVGKRVKCESFNPEYYQVETRGVEELSADSLQTATATTNWTVDTIDAKIFLANDTVKITGELDGTPTRFDAIIMSKTDTSITIKQITGDNWTTLHTIPASTEIYRISSASSEREIKEEPFTMYPEPSNSRVQKFIATIDSSTAAQIHKKEVQWGLPEMERAAIKDLRNRKENAYWDGKEGEVIGADGKKHRTVGGIYNIEDVRTKTVAADPTNKDWADLARFVFANSNGTTRKVAFASDGALEILNGIESIEKQLGQNQVNDKVGLIINSISTVYGTIDIIPCPSLTRIGHDNDMVILDMEFVEEKYFRPQRIVDFDLIGSGQADAEQKSIIEECTIQFKNLASHSIVTMTASE